MIYIGDTPWGTEQFPNGETIYRTADENSITITMVYENDSDITKLIMAVKYLRDNWRDALFLDMYYVPYSRMDRAIEGYAFSLKYFCQIINELNFSMVSIYDPHSNVTPALINNVNVCYPNISEDKIKLTGADYVFYPDSGAYKKYTEYLDIGSIPYFYGNKRRDLSTGKITEYDLVNAPDINSKNILVIDDICVKGGTFILAAKALKAAGAKTVNLYVTHMEKAIYDGDILKTDWIDHIYTPNTMGIEITSDKITVV